MGSYYWLKLNKNIFKRHDLLDLRSIFGLPFEAIFIHMMAESIDHDGCLRYSEKKPYTARTLAPLVSTDEKTMQEALDAFLELELIEILDDGTIRIPLAVENIGSETEWAEKKRRQRTLPALINGSKRLNGELLKLPNGKTQFVDEKRYGGNGMLVLDRAEGRCEICGSDEKVVIHHNNGLSNEPEDLICLCSKCHGIAHNKDNNGHMSTMCPPLVHHVSTSSPNDVRTMSDKRIELRDKSKELRDKIEDSENNKLFSSSSSREEEWKPKKDEVFSYALENHLTCVSIFWDYYQARNWMIKDSPIRDWRSLLQVWEKNSKGKTKATVSVMENEYTKEHIRQKEIDSLKELDDLLEE